MIVEAILKEEEQIRQESEAKGEARGVQIGEARGVQIGEARGVQIGEARGIEKGVSAQRQTLLQLLHFRFPAIIEEESKKYATHFARIHNLDPLAELVNQLLIAPTLAAFEEKVLAALPKEQEQK